MQRRRSSEKSRGGWLWLGRPRRTDDYSMDYWTIEQTIEVQFSRAEQIAMKSYHKPFALQFHLLFVQILHLL